MPERKRYHIPGLLKVMVAVLLAGTVLVLSVSAVGNKDKERINNININILKIDGHTFISQEEIKSVLNKSAGKNLRNQPIGSLDLSFLEEQLRKLKWVKRAELFIDNRNVLQIKIEQNKPVARVFSSSANSFFISDNGILLPFRSSVSERIPIFTGFNADPDKLKHSDSILIDGIINIAEFLNADNFWMAQIDQIDISQSGKFEMVPKLGNQVIKFGDAEDCEIKFSKLLAFYKQVMNRTGWDRYTVIDLQFRDQVVAERRDAAQVKSDSLAALRIMKAVIENAKKTEMSDSSRIQLTDKPKIERFQNSSFNAETSREIISEIIPEHPAKTVPSVAPLKENSSDKNDEDKVKAEPENLKKNTGEEKNIENKKQEPPKKTIVVEREKKSTEQKSDLRNEKENRNEKKIPKAIMPPQKRN